jgi:uncharacterized protein YrzB (UPF0473 family)
VILLVKIYRQGDVVLRPVSRLPKYANKAGEQLSISSENGNPHTMQAAVYVARRNRQMQQYVVLEDEEKMTHPQHPTLVIPAGIYEVSNVHERDYAPRRAMD